MTSDAYTTSGGWAGGSPLNTGGVLSNYYQKLKTVDPSSGSLVTAQPAQATTQPASLARVATTTPATQATTAPTQPATTALPTIAAVPTVAAVTAVPATTSRAAVAGTGVVGTSSANAAPSSSTALTSNQLGGALSDQDQRAQAAAGPVPVFSGPLTKWVQVGNYNIRLQWDNVKQQYVYNPLSSQSMIYDTTNPAYQAHSAQPILQALFKGQVGAATPAQTPADEGYVLRNNAAAQAAIGQASTQANAADDTKNAVAAYATAQQAYNDKVSAYKAQDQADQASAFSLAGQLQAPNTSSVDEAGANDLARVVSQYRSGLGGVDAATYNYAAQGAQATQQAVNAANHATAYANAYNSNYSTFANALASQQTADANASGQKLQYDIQGISQAVQQLTQQASQLSATKQTQFNSALIPLQKQLQAYERAVKLFGATNEQTVNIAKGILTLASTFTAAAV